MPSTAVRCRTTPRLLHKMFVVLLVVLLILSLLQPPALAKKRSGRSRGGRRARRKLGSKSEAKPRRVRSSKPAETATTASSSPAPAKRKTSTSSTAQPAKKVSRSKSTPAPTSAPTPPPPGSPDKQYAVVGNDMVYDTFLQRQVPNAETAAAARLATQAVAPTHEDGAVLLVSTMDGSFHALDVATGRLRWTISTDKPLVSSFQATTVPEQQQQQQQQQQPRDGGPQEGDLLAHLDNDDDDDNGADYGDDYYTGDTQVDAHTEDSSTSKALLIPGRDGSVYFDTPYGLRKLPYKTKRLVENCPVSNKDMHFLGAKRSQILGVDLDTGVVRRSYESSAQVCNFGSSRGDTSTDGNLLWIGRRDHTLQAINRDKSALEWNVSFGEVLSPSFEFGDDPPIVGAMPDVSEETVEFPGPLLSASIDGTVFAVDRTSVATAAPWWKQTLTSAVASMHYIAGPGERPVRVPFVDIPPPGAPPPPPPSESQPAAPGPSRQLPSTSRGQALISAPTKQPHANQVVVWTLDDGQLFAMQPVTSLPGDNVPVLHMPMLPTYSTEHSQQLPSPRQPSGDAQHVEGGADAAGQATHRAPCEVGGANYPLCAIGWRNVTATTADEKALVFQPTDKSRLPGSDPDDGEWAQGGGDSGGSAGGGGGGGGASAYWPVITIGFGIAFVWVLFQLRAHTRNHDEAMARLAQLQERDALRDVQMQEKQDKLAQEVAAKAKAEAELKRLADGPSDTVNMEGVQHRVIGNLAVSEHVMGWGSHGTVVYSGFTLDGRPIAIKRILTTFHHVADNEVGLLIKSDKHPNVVRYYANEQVGEFVYVALERCAMSLASAVARAAKQRLKWLRKRGSSSGAGGDDGSREQRAVASVDELVEAVPIPSNATRVFLRALVAGVAHVHSLRIVHRDIKPHNFLLASLYDDASATAPSKDTSAGAGGGAGAGAGAGATPRPDRTQGLLASVAAAPGTSMGASVLDTADLKLRDAEHHSLGTSWCPKLSDMGLGKLLRASASSFGADSLPKLGVRTPAVGLQGGDDTGALRAGNDASSSGHTPGSVGWQAPELMQRMLQQLQACESSGIGSPDWPSDDGAAGAAEGGSGEPRTASALSGSSSSASSSSSSMTHRQTRAVDVWSLGCVLYHVLDVGEHPYGDIFDRESRVLSGDRDLSRLEHLPEAYDLVAAMLDTNPLRRPASDSLAEHPFFWCDVDRLRFLLELSDRLESEGADPAASHIVAALEAEAPRVLGPTLTPRRTISRPSSRSRRRNGRQRRGAQRIKSPASRKAATAEDQGDAAAKAREEQHQLTWDGRLPRELLEDAGRFRRYDTGSLRDLLRLIRNRRHHFKELPPHIQATMGESPVAFVQFFTSRFPHLLMACHRVACATLAHESATASLLGSNTAAAHAAASAQAAVEAEQARKEAARAEALLATARRSQASSAVIVGEGGRVHRAWYDVTPAWLDDAELAKAAASYDASAAVHTKAVAGLGWQVPRSGSSDASSAGGTTVALAAAPAPAAAPDHRDTRYKGGYHRDDPRYKTSMCRDWVASGGKHCARGSRCDFAHGKHELRKRPRGGGRASGGGRGGGGGNRGGGGRDRSQGGGSGGRP